MSEQKRKAHFNVFFREVGHHRNAWRLPETTPEREYDYEFYVNIARIAERGLLDCVFMADGYVGTGRRLEPFTLLSAIAVLTKRIGLIATAGTTYNEPFHVARKFASLDHISRGRATWNVVTGHTAATSLNFGRPQHPEHSERYAMAEEFVDVVKLLWDSWEESGLLWDKQSGVRFDPDKLHPIQFRGKVYSVEGHLSIPRPPQGHPVIVQAGSSDSGKELAARTAEVIFTIQASLQSSQRFYNDVKGRMSTYGRSPDQLLVMPGLNTILGTTAAEAQDLEDRLNELNNTNAMIANIYERFGIDLSGYPLDEPVPSFEDANSIDTADGKGHYQVVLDITQGQNLTIRQLINRLSGASGHMNFTGTPLQLADLIESWITNRGCDGFNLMSSLLPDGLELFVDHVIPELQNRGLFRTAYEGPTLRDNLGLARPANVFAFDEATRV